jgi:hypothetical protein
MRTYLLLQPHDKSRKQNITTIPILLNDEKFDDKKMTTIPVNFAVTMLINSKNINDC